MMIRSFAMLMAHQFIRTALLFILSTQLAAAQQLVLPGDHPDPSVTKVGNLYWASATTSNWAPAFPLLTSKDLVHWKLEGHVFNELPAWADYYFWAPEMTYDNGKVYVYYAAHKKGGNLCVGVASADNPKGPYRDHGPLICQEAGSIDAFPMRDENGKLYLVWKEDANSVGRPTAIWAQPMNEERTALTGEKKELFRNTEPWEANLVEGVSMKKHGDYYYAFYAAAGCCGAGCSYGTGIARSKNLLGPWEKYSRNPVLANSGRWTCPGHGTPVEKDGKNYFLYHAYDKRSTVFTGREGLLIEYRFTPDGWIEFVGESSGTAPAPAAEVKDDFGGKTLSDRWQWSVFQQPRATLKGGRLFLPAANSGLGNFLGRATTSGQYTVTVKIDVAKSTAGAGVAAIGDDKNLVAAYYQGGAVHLAVLKDGKESEITSLPVPAGRKLRLRMEVQNGKELRFSYNNHGNTFIPLTMNGIDGGYLPPWDRAVRAGIIAKGGEGTAGVFDSFEMKDQ